LIEEEIDPLDVSVKKDGKRNTPCRSKVSRENRDNEIQFNACDKADDFSRVK